MCCVGGGALLATDGVREWWRLSGSSWGGIICICGEKWGLLRGLWVALERPGRLSVLPSREEGSRHLVELWEPRMRPGGDVQAIERRPFLA